MIIKESLFEADKTLTITSELWPENAILMAPKEFIALMTNYILAVEDKDYFKAVQAMASVERWLQIKDNVKQICLIKNIGA